MRNTESIIYRIFDVIIAHPVVVLSAFLACAAALGWQVRHFEVDASADTLLMRGDKSYIHAQLVYREFGDQEFMFVAYKPLNRSVFDRDTLDDLRDFSDKLEALDRVSSARSILNVPIILDGDGGLASGSDFSAMTMENREYSPDELREALSGHSVYEDLLINRNQTVLAIQLIFDGDKELMELEGRILDLEKKTLDGELTAEEQREINRLERKADPMRQRLQEIRRSEFEEIRRIAEEHEDGAEIHMGGVHVLAYQLIRIIRNDLIVFGSAIAAMICLVLFMLFGKLRWVVIPAVCCICSVLPTMGLFGLLGLKTTVISSNFIALQLILTLALVMHLIVQYRECSAEHPDWTQAQRIKKTIKMKAAPCFYAGLTTSAGFASLLFSGIQPVISFGWMMIIAMFFSIGASLILFPSMIALFPREDVSTRWRAARSILNGMAALSLKRPAFIVLMTLCVLGGAAAGMPRLTVENSFINYFRDTTSVHQELSFIDRELGGTTPLDIVHTLSPSKDKDDLVMTAAHIRTMQRIQQAIGEYEAVGKMLSLVNFAELAVQMNRGRPLTEYELTAAYWLMGEEIREELFGAAFSPETRQARFSMRIKDSTEGLNRAELIADIRKDMERISDEDEPYMLTGLFVLYQEILEQLFRSQILTIGLVLAALLLTLLAIFRSIRVALIGITPNILTTVVVLGTMGWLDIALDLMTITVAAIAMGITIDNTIHYTHRYLGERLSGTARRSVEHTHGSVGFAILYTSVVIMTGFSLLAFSDFLPSALFGLLTSLAMAVSFAYNLSMLPILLNRFVKDTSLRGQYEST